MAILKKRIVKEDGSVRLGGSNQDKICSAMLLNNLFESIGEWNERRVKKHYFPYILPASEALTELEPRRPGFEVRDKIFHITYNAQIRADEHFAQMETELDPYGEIDEKFIEDPYWYDTKRFRKKLRRLGIFFRIIKPVKPFESKKFTLNPSFIFTLQRKQRKERYHKAITQYKDEISSVGLPDQMGIFKRYFHVWKGANCISMKSTFDPEDENLSRFSILIFKRDSSSDPSQLSFNSALEEFRNKGIIRIIAETEILASLKLGNSPSDTRMEDRYYQYAIGTWLENWLPETRKKRK